MYQHGPYKNLIPKVSSDRSSDGSITTGGPRLMVSLWSTGHMGINNTVPTAFGRHQSLRSNEAMSLHICSHMSCGFVHKGCVLCASYVGRLVGSWWSYLGGGPLVAERLVASPGPSGLGSALFFAKPMTTHRCCLAELRFDITKSPEAGTWQKGLVVVQERT